MATSHHSFAQFDGGGGLLLAFQILDTAGTPTIVEVSPPLFHASDLAITDTGTGVYDVVISNFKGPRGIAKVFATPVTISLMAGCTARSYSGDALSITIKVEADDSTATDSSVDVLVLAY
jgi:hypothetical protein